MDWSLVLASQGIGTTIDYSHDGNGWSLLVNPADYENALNAIRLYRLENRGWPWQNRVPGPEVLFDWGSLAWVALLILFFYLQTRYGFKPLGIASHADLTNGQWWRWFTAIWLHADLGHLASNAVFGFLLLGLSMGRYGTGLSLLAAYLAGASANLISELIYTDKRQGLGASGMVMGALGLLAVQSFWPRQKAPLGKKYLIGGIAAGIMLFALLGLAPGTNVIAHLAGFIVGIISGALLSLAKVRPSPQSWKLNVLSGLAFTVLVVLPWWLAIKAGGP